MIRFPQKFRFCAILFLAVFLACQNKPQRIGMPPHFSGTIPDTLTVMSYNVENLFDMTDNGDEYPEFKPNACNWTQNTFQAKLNNIASVIAAVGPQIVVLVEVENENAVRRLCAVCLEQKCPFPFFAIGDQTSGSNTRPVIMSKLPVLWEKSFGMVAGAPHERPMLEAAIYCGADTLRVFACHWPSKKNPESRRVERAKLLLQLLADLSPSQDYIVAGDFNENYDECETFRTAGLDDSKGFTGINAILGTVRSPPGEGVVYRSKRDLTIDKKTAFFDPWTELAENERMSEMFQGRRETPDHILLPQQLFDNQGFSYLDSSFRVFTWNGRLVKDGVPYRWQMRYAKHQRIHVGEGFSDHLPIALRLVRGPYRAAANDSTSSKPDEKAIGKRGGFEDGADGFLACTKKIRVERDTTLPRSGRYCLRLWGLVKSNGCAARARLSLPSCGPDQSELFFSLRGSGTLNVRVALPGSKQWIYFNGANFSPGKGGKYTPYDFTKWKSVGLGLDGLPENASEVELEIRTKKDCELNLWIDDVRVRCRQ